ncbi:conserved hypothetical protein [Burkholderia sp. H160]|nr:conserved hypothetical protein [Burkholderia sp. H160]
MSTDVTANQQDPRHCDNCGAPLIGRFSPCLSCHSLALEGLGAYAAPGPARRIWYPSSSALFYRYDSIDEAELVAKVRRRSRRRILLAASVLAVSCAVPLAFIHGNDLRVGAPVAATGIVSAPNGKPSIAVAGRPGAGGGQSRPSGFAQRQQHPQQQPADVAQRVASVRSAPVAPVSPPAASILEQRPVVPAPVTPPGAPPLEQHRVASTTPDAAPATAAAPVSAEDKLRAAAPPSAVAQRPAPVRTSAATPPAASPPEQRGVASATPEPTHATAPQPISAEDQRLADAQRYLRAAHVSLKANNLSAAKSRIAAALAAQPDNRDAQRLRSTVHTLEQQRDALLGLARGCAHIESWACTSHNAGIALQIDPSSKEARRLATLAERPFGLPIEPPADAVTRPSPEVRFVSTHH